MIEMERNSIVKIWFVGRHVFRVTVSKRVRRYFHVPFGVRDNVASHVSCAEPSGLLKGGSSLWFTKGVHIVICMAYGTSTIRMSVWCRCDLIRTFVQCKMHVHLGCDLHQSVYRMSQ